MAIFVRILLGGAFWLGCSSQPAPANPFGQTPTTVEPRLNDAGALVRLRQNAILLGATPGPLEPSAASQTLYDLGLALDVVARAPAAKVRATSSRLRSTPRGSLAHASLLKEGLMLARQALLAARPPPPQRDQLRLVLHDLGRDVAAVSDVTPLDQQRVAVSRAFRSATDAAFLARGREPPFASSTRSAVPTSPLPYEVELEQARRAVLALARTSWDDGRQEAASALEALAEVIGAAAGDRPPEAELAEIRFQARRVRQGQTTFGQAGWIKAGLSAVLDAFERLDADVSPHERTLRRAARRSLEGIRDHSTLSFERAAVQDAFRATVDALGRRAPEPATEPAATALGH